MQTTEIIRVPPAAVRFKLDYIHDLTEPRQGGDWDRTRRISLELSDKHRAMHQRFVEGMAWEDTDLFRKVYQARFARGEQVRGCTTIEELLRQYYYDVDGLYADMRDHGFRERIEGAVPSLPEVFIARDGEPILTNQGNHRVAIAKLLNLPWILARVRVMHEQFEEPLQFERVEFDPKLHAGADEIPAMTTPAEKFAYYELARDRAQRGAVVELGTWLGAATCYIAAGVRDAGVTRPMHSYDRFRWQAIHEYKAGGPLKFPMFEQVEHNLGPLRPLVELHKGEIAAAQWHGGRIAVLIADGPKRVREVCKTLLTFGIHLEAGDVMAWQDFAFFPSYDQVVCLDNLERRGLVRFERGVFPGTTGIFTVLRKLRPSDCAEEHFRLEAWSPDEIISTWRRWAERLPTGQRPRFGCGAALFLHDRGARDQAVAIFRELLQRHRPAIEDKWIYLREKRDNFTKQYSALFDVLDSIKS